MGCAGSVRCCARVHGKVFFAILSFVDSAVADLLDKVLEDRLVSLDRVP